MMRVDDEKPKNLLNGFIDVKIPPKGRKLGPWKAWKRQWCTIQKSTTDNGIELVFGNNSRNVNNTIIVPQYATLCRSESRTRPYAFGIFLSESKNHHAVVFLSGRSETESQEWMAHIRTLLRPSILPVLGEEFSVSLIDNSFSRSSGLYGIYGILNLNETEMVIRDPRNGEVSASWKWSQIERNYVRQSTHTADDTGKIFIFQIRSEDKRATGEKLCLFCPQAEELQSAVSQYRLGRQHRLVTSPLPPTPPPPGYFGSHSMRRLSRSEGDLRWPLESSMALLNLRSPCSSRERNSNSLSRDDDKDGNSLGKIAKSLIMASASFSLLLSTPGCSDPDSLNEYQAICDYQTDNSCNDDESNNKSYYPNKNSRSQSDIDHDSETDDLGDLFSHQYFRTVSAPSGNYGARRVSGASVASGIYAEIDESPNDTDSSTKYQNLSDFTSGYQFDMYPSNPPPLPPRRTNESYVSRNTLNCSANSFNNDLIKCTKNETNEQSTETVTENQQSTVGSYFPESQYIMINIKGTEENYCNNQTVNSLPPPLPPRQPCDITESQEHRENNSNAIIMMRQQEEYTNCDRKILQVPEPDYLPMSQVPSKIVKNEDTYVVMANIINNKMSANIAESVP